MSEYRDKKCMDCKHWHINPANPAEVTIRAQRIGACRVEPPQGIVGMTPTNEGLQPVLVRIQYKSPPGWFPACGKFEQASEDELKYEPAQPIQMTNDVPEDGKVIDLGLRQGQQRKIGRA